MKFKLKEETINKINQVFKKYDKVEKTILYGSRAKGNAKYSSDIDLTLIGKNINLKLLNKISMDIDDLLLPYITDLSIYHHIKNQDLIDHISRVGKIFYTNVQK
ncbi:DNA polymerase [Candidatus Magnetomorum sp. HK-1]|nr:DNA polymerase [Candidatus Magnetomorum sp. HK-1]